MATTLSDRAAAEPAARSAVRFFWCWLVVATSMSLCGNVAHALLAAPDGFRWMAAVAALVPPTVLIAGNHSMASLVRTRAGGGVYWVALVATVLLALGAFVLSFDALRSLAVAVGIRASIAWIWPAVIDVAIAQATLGLVALTRSPGRTAADHDRIVDDGADGPPRAARSETTPVTELVATDESAAARPLRGAGVDQMGQALFTPLPDRGGADIVSGGLHGAGAPVLSGPVRERALSAVRDAPTQLVDGPGSLDAAAVRRWQPVAESFVREGITPRTEPELVATILAELEAGTRPGTIERRHNVHHSTVKKVLAAADELTG